MTAHPSNPREPSKPLPKPLVIALSAVAGIGILALGVLIVRELSPHHAVLGASGPKAEATSVDESSDTTSVATPASTVASASKPTAPASARGAAATPAARADGLVRVRALLSIIHDPQSVPTDGVFHNRQRGVDQYSYDSFGPYRRGELKRDAKNPDSWEVDGSNGPGHPTNVEDIAPPGGTRQAATIRDDKGNAVSTWYSVDAGPLAPAYATVLATGGTRIVSRAYLEANRASFPQALVAVLDH